MYRLKHIESEALHADVVVDVSTTTSQPEVETTGMFDHDRSPMFSMTLS